MEDFIYTELELEIGAVTGKKRLVYEDDKYLTSDIRRIRASICDIDNGSCTTFFTPDLCNLDNMSFSILSREIGAELRAYICQKTDRTIDNSLSVLVVGVGNGSLNSDALGPETVSQISVTGHLTDRDLSRLGRCRIFSVAPNVTVNTGFETADILKAYVKFADPHIVIVVDSLAAKGYERLARAVQISNVGITPGGGIGESRKRLSQKEIGVPIISIGIPTVINSSSLIADTLTAMKLESDDSIKYILERGKGFFVTVKEVDLLVRSASMLISSAIDIATKV